MGSAEGGETAVRGEEGAEKGTEVGTVPRV